MIERYKKTFVPMQAFILVVALAAAVWSGHVEVGAAFFVVMQIGAIFGAIWGHRLKLKVERMPIR
ncbi:MAG TPA: hypothetical protein VHE30_02325 [Polyangiaceae bacterium]|nr:hypothetical protein [Polyangiaceae bacterium]